MCYFSHMKLTEEQVERIVTKVVGNLKEKALIVYKADERAVHKRMVDAFLADLRAEDKLDDEVKEILSSHSKELDESNADYRKMFNMVKGKLARERGLTL